MLLDACYTDPARLCPYFTLVVAAHKTQTAAPAVIAISVPAQRPSFPFVLPFDFAASDEPPESVPDCHY